MRQPAGLMLAFGFMTASAGCSFDSTGMKPPDEIPNEIEQQADDVVPALYTGELPEPEVAEPIQVCETVEPEAPMAPTCETFFERSLVEIVSNEDGFDAVTVGAAEVEFTDSGLVVRGESTSELNFTAVQLYAGTSAAPIIGDRVAHELFPTQVTFDEAQAEFELKVAYDDIEVACGDSLKLVLRFDAELAGVEGYSGWLLGNDGFGPGRGYFEYYEKCCPDESVAPEPSEVCEWVTPEPEEPSYDDIF